MSVLSLQKSVIYGPVRSRRLGASLGVNLLPSARKFCSYNCVYCQYGWTDRHGLEIQEGAELPSVADVEAAVTGALSKGPRIDYVTLAGNGEPTLHPGFAEVVDLVNRLRDRYAPDARSAVLSNASTVHRPEIRHALGKLDAPIMKLDVGTQRCWRRFNRPCPGIEWKGVVEGLEALDRPVIQALFAEGEHGNADKEEIAAWVALLKRIRPAFVQVYSLDRPTPARALRPVERSGLQTVARQAKQGAGVSVGVF